MRFKTRLVCGQRTEVNYSYEPQSKGDGAS